MNDKRDILIERIAETLPAAITWPDLPEGNQPGVSVPPIIAGLTEGRIVHFVLPEGARFAGQHRASMLVKVWDHHSGMANLLVFMDGVNDAYGDNTVWFGSIYYSEAKEPGTWHWIEKA